MAQERFTSKNSRPTNRLLIGDNRKWLRNVTSSTRQFMTCETRPRFLLMQWLNQSADDAWDLQMKRDAAAGKFNTMIKEGEADYREGRTTEFP